MRRLWWYLLVVPISAVGVMAGAVLVQSHVALTPVLETSYSELSPAVPKAKSLAELYQGRDRLRAELEQQPPPLISAATGAASVPLDLLQTLQATEIRIQVEETAQENWKKAIRLANQATTSGAAKDSSQASAQKLYSLWKEAVGALKAVNKDSFLAQQATRKLKEYEPNLDVAAYRYDTARSGFLKKIADDSGMGSRVHVTVCTLERECRRYQGSEPPASPASLIKVPIAIATMQKLASQKIDPKTPIMVSRGNYTEDAAKIWVGQEYPISKVLLQMISYSSNIATNQLIDYVGWDYISQVLQERGYRVTQVKTKLVGDRTYPSGLGNPPNFINTDELTDMMVGIYNNEHPGDDLILEGLVNQYDWALGYEATKRPAVWIGEKTGQNSKVLGSTTGVNIRGDRYVITVAIDNTGSEPAVRKVIRGVVQHLIEQGGFESGDRRSTLEQTPLKQKNK